VAARRSDKGDETRILANIVSPAYFATFGIPVVHGRNFTREEALTQQPVVILSETTAKKLWPNEDPLGKTIRTRIPHPPFQDAEVIGIVKDVANEGVLYPDRDCLYFPTEIGVSDGGALVVRSKAAPGTTATVAWKPQLAQIVSTPNTSEVFDSTRIPGEIMDLMVVNSATLKANPNFGKALIGAWYETMTVVFGKDPRTPAALAAMAKASGTTVVGFNSQLATTKIFNMPADAVAFTSSPNLLKTMDLVRTFSFNHGLLGQGARSPDWPQTTRSVPSARARRAPGSSTAQSTDT